MSSGDYNNSSGGAACSYASQGNYTADYSMSVPFQGKLSKGMYITPSWGSIGHADLTNKVPTCSGYFDVNSAYGSNAGNCQTTYRTSLCGNRPMKQDCGSLPPSDRTSCCVASCQQMNWRPGMPNPDGCNPPLPGQKGAPDNTCRNLLSQ
jgi:hypothetical protein